MIGGKDTTLIVTLGNFLVQNLTAPILAATLDCTARLACIRMQQISCDLS